MQRDCWTFAVFLTVYHVSSLFSSIFSAVGIDASLGWPPMLLLLCGVHLKVVHSEDSLVILIIWPVHCYPLLSVTAESGVLSVSLNNKSLLMVYKYPLLWQGLLGHPWLESNYQLKPSAQFTTFLFFFFWSIYECKLAIR